MFVITGVNRYGLYSLFPGGGGGNYVAATPATPGPATPATARTYHATTHKGKFTAIIFLFMSLTARVLILIPCSFQTALSLSFIQEVQAFVTLVLQSGIYLQHCMAELSPDLFFFILK